MISKRHVCAALVFLCAVSAAPVSYAQSDSDVGVVLNAVPTNPSAFVGVAPCRLADTRSNGAFPTGPFGPPSMLAQTPRVFPVAGNCGVPLTAQAVSVNIAVTNTSAAGFISVWPGDAMQPTPLVASQNFAAGQTIANAVLAPLGGGGITVYARVGLDVIIDVNGYFDTGALPTHEIGAAGEPAFHTNSYCSWSNYENGWTTAGFYKDVTGVVHLKGLVKATDGFGCDLAFADGVIFTLPPGFRPALNSLFTSITNEQIGRLDVGPDGRVQVGVGTPNMTANMKAWITLDGISFKATQ